ncbi:uncharacterized protein DDB_G0283697-like [Aphis gossypii]|uniref:uncharacterized protein DDB_G0283697-like n=1 Tax=Aphis gossypii TaxID=80765 RepID=UPI0021598B81|nr:uncharacterized protein DDB_G0283697-like [Aphis gossypii]
MSNLKKYDKTVNFEDRSRNRDKSPYSGNSNYKGWNNYRENSPYPDRYNNNKYRDNSKDTYDNKGYRENSRERDRFYSRERKNSYDRSKNRSKDRGNNSNTKQYKKNVDNFLHECYDHLKLSQQNPITKNNSDNNLKNDTSTIWYLQFCQNCEYLSTSQDIRDDHDDKEQFWSEGGNIMFCEICGNYVREYRNRPIQEDEKS